MLFPISIICTPLHQPHLHCCFWPACSNLTARRSLQPHYSNDPATTTSTHWVTSPGDDSSQHPAVVVFPPLCRSPPQVIEADCAEPLAHAQCKYPTVLSFSVLARRHQKLYEHLLDGPKTLVLFRKALVLNTELCCDIWSMLKRNNTVSGPGHKLSNKAKANSCTPPLLLSGPFKHLHKTKKETHMATKNMQ